MKQFLLLSISVSWGCHNILPQTWWPQTKEVVFHSSGGQKSEINESAGPHSFWRLKGRITCSSMHSLVCSYLPAVYASFFTWPSLCVCVFSSVSYRGMSLYFPGPGGSAESTATHSSILAWKIPQTEESGRLCSIGSQRIKHDSSDLVCTQGYKLG